MDSDGIDDRPSLLTDEFMIMNYKVEPCVLSTPHAWKLCPFVHKGEPVKRRPPQMHCGHMCPAIKEGKDCPRGAACCYAHNSFELWLHPSRFKTSLCRQGTACKRTICFFAHTPSELRPQGAGSPPMPAPKPAPALAPVPTPGSPQMFGLPRRAAQALAAAAAACAAAAVAQQQLARPASSLDTVAAHVSASAAALADAAQPTALCMPFATSALSTAPSVSEHVVPPSSPSGSTCSERSSSSSSGGCTLAALMVGSGGAPAVSAAPAAWQLDAVAAAGQPPAVHQLLVQQQLAELRAFEQHQLQLAHENLALLRMLQQRQQELQALGAAMVNVGGAEGAHAAALSVPAAPLSPQAGGLPTAHVAGAALPALVPLAVQRSCLSDSGLQVDSRLVIRSDVHPQAAAEQHRSSWGGVAAPAVPAAHAAFDGSRAGAPWIVNATVAQVPQLQGMDASW